MRTSILGSFVFLALAIGPAQGGQNLLREVEPNNSAATAMLLGSANVAAFGRIAPGSDVDYWSFTASAGDRVYAATMTFWSSAGLSGPSVIDLIGPDGTTIVETDLDNGVLAPFSSSIGGAPVAVSGTYYLAVRAPSPAGQLLPYHLHFQRRSGAPVSESEPNDSTVSAQPLPGGGWVSGATTSAVDVDTYSVSLNAGDTLYASLDLDPERDGVEWNGRIGIGQFAGATLIFNDPGSAGADSEAGFLTVRAAGTYYVSVSAAAATFGSYHLGIAILPAEAPAGSCTTYSSTTPVAIPDLGTASSTITVPGNPRIADLDVSIQLNHANMTNLDVQLRSPSGNNNGLFADSGVTAFPSMNLTLDDEAAFPVNSFTVLDGTVVQPFNIYRLSWFDGEGAGGPWTLDIHDDAAGSAGTLTGWSLTICEPPPDPCGGTRITLYESDFESGAGGFTTSGPLNEWQRGLPAGSEIANCHSGTQCWKTRLAGNYSPNGNMDLVSPLIDLTGVTGPITASWAQKYQMDTAVNDHAYAEVVPAAGPPNRLFEHDGANMRAFVGPGPTTIQESAGWGVMSADISGYAGTSVALRFHMDSDAASQLAGYAIDDVEVTWCCTAAACDDADPCTIDSCGAGGCLHAPAPAPGEAASLTVAPDKQTLTWSAVPLAARYDVVRGSFAALPVGPGGGDETCFNDLATPTVVDASVPPAGAGLWYLVRGQSTCGTGTWGTTSAGGPRLTASCP